MSDLRLSDHRAGKWIYFLVASYKAPALSRGSTGKRCMVTGHSACLQAQKYMLHTCAWGATRHVFYLELLKLPSGSFRCRPLNKLMRTQVCFCRRSDQDNLAPSSFPCGTKVHVKYRYTFMKHKCYWYPRDFVQERDDFSIDSYVSGFSTKAKTMDSEKVSSPASGGCPFSILCSHQRGIKVQRMHEAILNE